MYLSEDLIQMEFDDQVVTWNIESHNEYRSYEIYYCEGELGTIIIIIYNENMIAIGDGVLFEGSSIST
ncbi:MAG: hypothetical protein ACFFAS_21155 [Promethearchaeota archaeon]